MNGEYTLSKAERLCGEKTISRLFTEGESGFAFPFRYQWRISPAEEGKPQASVLFSVPKKHHRRAVKRNLLKRRTREAYRLNKAMLTSVAAAKGVRLEIALIYSTKDVLQFKPIENGVKKILAEISKRL